MRLCVHHTHGCAAGSHGPLLHGCAACDHVPLLLTHSRDAPACPDCRPSSGRRGRPPRGRSSSPGSCTGRARGSRSRHIGCVVGSTRRPQWRCSRGSTRPASPAGPCRATQHTPGVGRLARPARQRRRSWRPPTSAPWTAGHAGMRRSPTHFLQQVPSLLHDSPSGQQVSPHSWPDGQHAPLASAVPLHTHMHQVTCQHCRHAGEQQNQASHSTQALAHAAGGRGPAPSPSMLRRLAAAAAALRPPPARPCGLPRRLAAAVTHASQHWRATVHSWPLAQQSCSSPGTPHTLLAGQQVSPRHWCPGWQHSLPQACKVRGTSCPVGHCAQCTAAQQVAAGWPTWQPPHAATHLLGSWATVGAIGAVVALLALPAAVGATDLLGGCAALASGQHGILGCTQQTVL